MNNALRWFYVIWLGLVLVLNMLGVIGTYLSPQPLYETWLYVT